MNQNYLENASNMLSKKYRKLFITMYDLVNSQDSFNENLERCCYTVYYDLQQENVKLNEIVNPTQKLKRFINH